MMNQILTTDKINLMCSNTLVSHLGISIESIEYGKVKASMPIDHRTIQPMGKLHGGATIALSETVSSVGSLYLVNPEQYAVFATEVNASHISVGEGESVFAVASIIHVGRGSHVWEVKIQDERDKLISVCRITNRIVSLKSEHK